MHAVLLISKCIELERCLDCRSMLKSDCSSCFVPRGADLREWVVP